MGARGWDTPGSAHDVDILDDSHFPVHAARKRQRRLPPVPDDVSLDAFQRHFTSEDNASFVQILDQENRRRREEKFGWAFDAERMAEARRIEQEAKRKMILDTATSGQWRVDANGRRLIGGLAEGGTLLVEPSDQPTETLAKSSDQLAETLAKSSDQPTETLAQTSAAEALAEALAEIPLPPKHPLAEALADAGLPPTALISSTDGKIVPHHEAASGALTVAAPQGDRKRGDNERKEWERRESQVLGEERADTLSAAGSGVDLWKYKARNNFMFLPDADTNPYPDPSSSTSIPIPTSLSLGPRRSVKHANTRLLGDDPISVAGVSGEKSNRGGSVRASSPSSSLIDAAVRGTPYRQDGDMPSVNDYALVRPDASPSPQDLPFLLTSGTLLATPRPLGGQDADPLLDADKRPAFKLPETKKRDELGRRLADKASRSMRDRARLSRGYSMAPPATPRRQADSLTPAAKRLLEKTVGRTPGGASRTPSGSTRMNRGWTPTPRYSR